jgi:hypothetical protein
MVIAMGWVPGLARARVDQLALGRRPASTVALARSPVKATREGGRRTDKREQTDEREQSAGDEVEERCEHGQPSPRTEAPTLPVLPAQLHRAPIAPSDRVCAPTVEPPGLSSCTVATRSGVSLRLAS